MSQHERFFVGDNANFFLPLNGKYRECGYACIRSLYDALNGPDTDFRTNLVRQDVIDLFIRAVKDVSIFEGDGEAEEVKLSLPELAKLQLKRLTECGWVETYRDPGHMITAYRITWMGRRFASALMQDEDNIRIDTQNTRSTLAHLSQFVTEYNYRKRLDTDALMMALKSARGVVNDFTEAIEHTVTRRCHLITSLNESSVDAAERGRNVIDYMAGQLVEELTDRFMRDNIELFQQQIIGLLNTIDEWGPDVQIECERALRRRHPGLLARIRSSNYVIPSLFRWSRHQIERYVLEASDVLMPELRREVDSLVKRARMHFDYISRLNYQTGETDSIMSVLQKFEKFSPDRIESVLEQAEPFGRRLDIGLINIDKVIPPNPPRQLEEDNALEESRVLTEAEQREVLLKRNIGRLFYTSSDKVRAYLFAALRDTRFVELKELPVVDTEDLMCALTALSCASSQVLDPVSQKPIFVIRQKEGRIETPYFESDNYEIQYTG